MHDLAADARTGLGDVAAQAAAARANRVDHGADLARVLQAGIRIAGPVGAAIDIGNRRRVHPVRRAEAAGPAVLVRADVDERRRVAVIRGVHHDEVALPRVGTREAKRQLVGFAARRREEAHLERRWEARGQLGGVLERRRRCR